MKEKELMSIILKDIEEDEQRIASHRAVFEAMKKHDGSKITLRIKLPDGMRFEFRYGMCHIVNTVSGKDIQHLISYNGIYSEKRFADDYDSPNFSAAIDRADKLNRIISNKEQMKRLLILLNRIEKSFTGLKKSFNEMKNGHEFDCIRFPAYYSAMRYVLGENYTNVSSLK